MFFSKKSDDQNGQRLGHRATNHASYECETATKIFPFGSSNNTKHNTIKCDCRLIFNLFRNHCLHSTYVQAFLINPLDHKLIRHCYFLHRRKHYKTFSLKFQIIWKRFSSESRVHTFSVTLFKCSRRKDKCKNYKWVISFPLSSFIRLHFCSRILSS